MRYASWSAGFAVQLLAFRRPWVVFYAKKVNCFVFASKRASASTRARMPVTCQHARCPRRTPPRRSHTRFCFCTVITDILPYYKDYKRPGKWGGLLHGSFEKLSFFQSYTQAFFIRSYGDICGLPSGRAPRRRTDTLRSGSGSASHCGGIPLPDKTAWACIFQSPRP